jgi:tetratricopeptide (TPR) repeat protein
MQTRRVEQEPDNRVELNNLAYLYGKIGDAHLGMRAGSKKSRAQEEQAALLAYQAALPIVRRLVNGEPGHLLWLNGLAELHGRIGQIHADSLFRSASTEQEMWISYQEALEIRERLVGMDPGTLDWKYRLAELHEKTGDLKITVLDALESALPNYEAAIRIASLRVDGHEDAQLAPLLQRCQRRLANTYWDMGERAQIMNRPREALASYEKALPVAELLLNREPDNCVSQYRAATVYQKIGEMHMKLGEPEAALQNYRRVIEIGGPPSADPAEAYRFESLMQSARTGIEEAGRQLSR